MRKVVEEGNKRRKTTNKVKVKSRIKEKKKIEINLTKKQRIGIVLGVVVVLLIICINNYTALGLVLNKNIDSNDVVEVELQTSNNQIIPFENEILVYNNGIIKSYNNYGKNTGEIIIEDTVEADVQTCGKYIQVINKDRGLVYVYKNKYEVARIKVDGQIYSGNINEEGTSVIEYSSTGNKTILGVFDNSGKQKYNVKLSNNIVGKYVLSDNSKYLAYVDINVSGISAQTKINLIDLSNIKQDEANTKTIHTEDNALAYDMYWNGKTIVARFDESYMIYNVGSEKKEIAQISFGQTVSIGDYDKKCAYTEIDENGNYELNIKNMTSENVKTVSLDDSPKYFAYENGIAYVCYGKKIEAYNNFGMKIKTYNSDMVITGPVTFNNGRSIVMAISNKLIMFTI